ncbi:RHS repeat-associated core domain-containing protein [Pseudomonas sp. NPDC089407]|uniref:RHS repeat-associated core domain-containing protein n=1 Tax=Pseudomonas sp. NPDC089407 TaxID=3364464 RepID=UPI00384F86BE
MLPLPDTHQNRRQLFYCNGKISTEMSGEARWRFLQGNGLILAQNNHKIPGLPSTLVACDQQRSVLSMHEGIAAESQAYSPYGHHIQGNVLLSLLAFNGERRDAVTGNYHLGNGYRQFSPVMMRFCSPDSWSPFGAGGLNAYGYCGGDPANRIDPTGHFWGIGKFFRRLFGMKPKTSKKVNIKNSVASENITQEKQYVVGKLVAASPGRSSVSSVLGFNDEFVAGQFEILDRIQYKSSNSNVVSKAIKSSVSWPDVAQGNNSVRSLDRSESRKTASLEVLVRELDILNEQTRGGGSTADMRLADRLRNRIEQVTFGQ